MAQIDAYAQQLKDAMKGLGTREQKIIDVITATTDDQRVQISNRYIQMFNTPLSCDFNDELADGFADLCNLIFDGRYYTWARTVFTAIKRAGTDCTLLYQAVLLMDREDYVKTSLVYEEAYGRNMYEDIKKDISGDFEKLLLCWLRNEPNCSGDPEKIARDINKAAKGLGTDEKVFIAVIVNSSTECYQQVCEKYKQLFNKTIEDEIKSEFSFTMKNALILASRIKQSRVDAVAWLLYKSMKGLGTDDETLNLITILFSGQYGGDRINQAFSKYGNLNDWIKGDTTGDYEKVLKLLWSESK